jgi:hypothetical protein
MAMPPLLNYSCVWAEFAERHYAKVFSKKYKNAWLKTREDIDDVCRRIDSMLDYSRADLISSVGQYKLVKLDFAVAGTRISPKSSGNRCILLVDEELRRVEVLLAYSKNDIGPPNETAKWEMMIKSNYVEHGRLFSL